MKIGSLLRASCGILVLLFVAGLLHVASGDDLEGAPKVLPSVQPSSYEYRIVFRILASEKMGRKNLRTYAKIDNPLWEDYSPKKRGWVSERLPYDGKSRVWIDVAARNDAYFVWVSCEIYQMKADDMRPIDEMKPVKSKQSSTLRGPGDAGEGSVASCWLNWD